MVLLAKQPSRIRL